MLSREGFSWTWGSWAYHLWGKQWYIAGVYEDPITKVRKLCLSAKWRNTWETYILDKTLLVWWNIDGRRYPWFCCTASDWYYRPWTILPTNISTPSNSHKSPICKILREYESASVNAMPYWKIMTPSASQRRSGFGMRILRSVQIHNVTQRIYRFHEWTRCICW
jgi:hypothetical protein